MTIDIYLERRLRVPEPIDIITSDTVRGVFNYITSEASPYQKVGVNVQLITAASTDATCEVVVSLQAESIHLIFDLVSVSFARRLFLATSHTIVSLNVLEIRSVITHLASLKSLNFPVPAITLEMLMRQFEVALEAQGQGANPNYPDLPNDGQCQVVSAMFLIAHELTHLDREFFVEMDGIWTQLASDLRADAEKAHVDDLIWRQRLERLASVVERHPVDSNIVYEEAMCDLVGIWTCIAYIKQTDLDWSGKRQLVASLATTIISAWLSEVVELALNLVLAEDYEYNEQLDTALLARCHCMASYAVVEWEHQTADSADEREFALLLNNDIDQLIETARDTLRSLFGEGSEQTWKRAQGMVALEIVDRERMKQLVLESI